MSSRSELHDSIERRLRAGAPAFGPRPTPALRERILAAVRSLPRAAPPVDRSREGTWIALAAAAAVLCSAWWLAERSRAVQPGAAEVVALSRDLLRAGAQVWSLPNRAEDNLRMEARNLWSDTTRLTEGVVRGLPAPLRARLERL
jgi:hypothetical protein